MEKKTKTIMTYVVLLTGRAGSGKDTAADYIVQSLQNKKITAKKLAFADTLKSIARELILMFYGKNVPMEEFYDQEKKQEIKPDFPLFDGHEFSLRSVLQKVGTEVFRNFLSPDVWCDSIVRKMGDTQVVVISDCRFPNELRYFNDKPSLSLRVNRKDQTKLLANNATHSSETQIDDLNVNFEIDNNASLEDFYTLLEDFLLCHVIPQI